MTTAPTVETTDPGSRITRPRLPSQRAVLREQIRATGLALRGPALIGIALIVLVTVVTGLQVTSMGAVVGLYEWPTLLPGLIGAILPLAVWAREERFGPGFLWTLPVDRRQHAATKIVAGWVWLMAGVALYGLWLSGLTLISGGQALPPETLALVPPGVTLPSDVFPPVPLDPSVLHTVPWAPGPLIWLVPFTGATACYLLVSALILGCRHPLRWAIGTVLLYALLSVAGDAAGVRLGSDWPAQAPDQLLWLLIESSYGLDALLTARTGTLSTSEILTTGERALVWRGVPHLADWGFATLIWTGAGLLAAWMAVSRHREGRRS